MIKIIKNINELEKIRECWDVLYKEDDNCTPFQSFDYNYKLSKRMGIFTSVDLNNRVAEGKASDIIKAFIDTPFSTEERHIRRVSKIDNYKA